MKRHNIRNWGLKLLALALAIVIYHILKPDSSHKAESHEQIIFKSR